MSTPFHTRLVLVRKSLLELFITIKNLIYRNFLDGEEQEKMILVLTNLGKERNIVDGEIEMIEEETKEVEQEKEKVNTCEQFKRLESKSFKVLFQFMNTNITCVMVDAFIQTEVPRRMHLMRECVYRLYSEDQKYFAGDDPANNPLLTTKEIEDGETKFKASLEFPSTSKAGQEVKESFLPFM